MKKFLLPLVATTLLLTGCSGSGKLDLPSGGTEVDVTKTEVIAEKCAKTARATLDAASSGISASLNLNGDVKSTYVDKSGEKEKTYKVNVTGFNADITLTTNRIFGKSLDDVEASLSIKNLKGKVDIEVESFSLQYELQPVELNVYLQDGFVYADASNSNLKKALPFFLKKFVPACKDLSDDDINKMIETYIGAERKVYYDASAYLAEIDIPDIPEYIDVDEIKEAVKSFFETMSKQVTLKDFLTVKTYEDSKWGAKVAVNKSSVLTILEKTGYSKEEAEEIMKGVTTSDATVVALTDKYSRMESIEAELAVAGSISGGTVDTKLGAKLAFEYGKVVEFPDLSKFSPLVVGK